MRNYSRALVTIAAVVLLGIGFKVSNYFSSNQNLAKSPQQEIAKQVPGQSANP